MLEGHTYHEPSWSHFLGPGLLVGLAIELDDNTAKNNK